MFNFSYAQDLASIKKINEEVKGLTGLDFFQLEATYASLGNSTGSHPPLFYTWARLASEGKITSILEFGSGMSTAYLHKIAQLYNIECCSIENNEQYFQMTKQLLELSQIDTAQLFLRPSLKNLREELSKQNFDLIFIDSCPGKERLELVSLYRNIFSQDAIIMIDDCQSHKMELQVKDLTDKERFPIPKIFLSEIRGIAVIDLKDKIDFIQFRNFGNGHL